MNWKEIEPKVQSLQRGIVDAMEWVKEKSEANPSFPEINPSFHTSAQMLEKSGYQIVVCGEVKKGKSSLLNSMIGREVLPVDSDVATSQVFRISNCEEGQESYELVFTDGSKERISQDELKKYGSQVEVNLRGEPLMNGRSLSFIQVRLPLAFLPKDVSIVDTPGLGALYKSHEFITQNYVSHASAVVFILNPDAPIVEQEVMFINKVLDVTPYILFVMTKIDLYKPDVVEAQLKRDEAILSDIYGKRNLVAPRIVKVSSKILMDAALGDDEEFRQEDYKMSNYPEMKDWLLSLSYRAVGLLRTGMALSETANQMNKCNAYIVETLKALNEDSQSLQKRIEEEQKALQDRLQAEWGADSSKKNSALSEITAICNSVTNRVQQVTALHGPIHTQYSKRVEDAQNMDELNHLCDVLPREIVRDVNGQWECIANEISTRVSSVLTEVQSSMDSITYSELDGEHRIDAPHNSASDKFNAVRTGFFASTFVGMAASALGLLAIPVVGWFVAPVAALVGWFMGKEHLLKKNKAEAQSKLSDLMREISGQFLNVQPGQTYSMVGKFVYELKKSAEESINKMLEERKKQMQRMMDEMKAKAQQSVEQKKREYDQWMIVKQEWDAQTTKVKSLIEGRKEIAKSLT